MSKSTFDPIAKVWSGPTRNLIFNDSLNLGFLMLNVIKTTPERVIQICDDSGAKMTCSEMNSRALKIANFLTSKVGLKHGDIVGVVANNSENVTPIVLACLILGVPINPLAPIMCEDDISYMYKKTKPKVIFCDAKSIEKVQKVVEKIGLDTSKIITLMSAVEGYDFIDEIITLEIETPLETLESSSLDFSLTLAFILPSSGTTSTIKGVEKSHRELIHQLYPFFPTSSNEPEIFFSASGIFWITGVYSIILSALYGFKRVITSQQITPELYMDIIDRHNVTCIICPPYVGALLLKSEKSRTMLIMKSVIIGGTVFTSDYVESLAKIFPNANLIRSYVMTEMCALVADWSDKKLSSSGRAMKNIKLKIIDDDGNALDALQLGQICCKALVPFLGYFNEPEKYSETVQADGWILTGDVGYFDEEGHLYVVDRVKNMIKVHGFQFSSKEIEDIIKKIDGVADCCVVALVSLVDGNDLIFAFVIKSENAEKLTQSKIEEIVHSQVIEQKKITGGVHFVEKFHHTATGKIKYDEMKKMAKEIYEKLNN